jgi:DNA primase catalytic subunit
MSREPMLIELIAQAVTELLDKQMAHHYSVLLEYNRLFIIETKNLERLYRHTSTSRPRHFSHISIWLQNRKVYFCLDKTNELYILPKGSHNHPKFIDNLLHDVQAYVSGSWRPWNGKSWVFNESRRQ